MPEHDPLGLWYSLLESVHAEYMGIRFARAPLASGDAEWLDLPHHEFDGIGGLWELHRRCYGEAGAGPLPVLRERSRPGAIATWWLFLRFAARPKTAVALWRGLDPCWRGPSPERSRPEAICWQVLEPEQTRALLARARREGVSVNSLLLWALGRAVEPALDLERGPIRWMIPVNLRGAIERTRPTSNHSSYVSAETPPGGSAQEVDSAIRGALARQDHFAAWRAFSIGPALGAGYIRRFYAGEARSGAPWVGVFSNLGVWPERTDSRGAGDAWIFCPPVSRFQPLGAGALTWRGRLVLAVQTHPALPVDKSEVGRWLDAWTKLASG